MGMKLPPELESRRFVEIRAGPPLAPEAGEFRCTAAPCVPQVGEQRARRRGPEEHRELARPAGRPFPVLRERAVEAPHHSPVGFHKLRLRQGQVLEEAGLGGSVTWGISPSKTDRSGALEGPGDLHLHVGHSPQAGPRVPQHTQYLGALIGLGDPISQDP